MKIHSIHTRQKLPISIDEAWEFLTDPHNLQHITPDDMGFIIKSGADRKTYPGQIIEYTVSPFLGLKTGWVTEITQVIDKHYFVDEQRFGPYALWHHKHFVKKIPGGVEMEDLVHYKLPLGWLGNLAHPMLVKPKLKKIFDYREKALEQKFGVYKR